MKKIIKIGIVAILLMMGLTACGKEEKEDKTSKLELSAQEIIDRVYDNISDDEMPELGNTDVTSENAEYYLGTKDIDYKKAIASEPLMSSIAWSVVVVELNDNADIEKSKNAIRDNVDSAKWVCVNAEKVIVESRDNFVILIMMDEDHASVADSILKNFKNL